MSGISGNRTISGTWGEVWVDGEKWAELTGGQAKFAYTKSDVQMCGQMAVDTKVTAVKGTGSITVNHVFTCNITRADQLVWGVDVRTTIIMKLADPDAYGYERVALYNVSFDDERPTCGFCFLTSASSRVFKYSRMSPYAASMKLCAAGLMDARQYPLAGRRGLLRAGRPCRAPLLFCPHTAPAPIQACQARWTTKS